MKLLTIFIAPKPFRDPHISTIQRNAVLSWKALGEEVDVVLVGDEEGIQQAAQEMGVKHIAEVQRNAQGTPLLSSIFSLARENSDSPLLAYVNADILLFEDFLEQSRLIYQKYPHFLLLGQRWDLDITRKLDFSANWQAELKGMLEQKGKLHPPSGSDYFIFPRECFDDLPDFAIGRAGWDNWMIYKARKENWPLIDCTPSIRIVHQNHDYAHLPGGQSHYRLPETAENIRLAGGERTIFTLADVNKKLEKGLVQNRAFSWKSFFREVEIFPLIKLKSYALAELSFAVFHPKKAYVRLRKWLRSIIKSGR